MNPQDGSFSESPPFDLRVKASLLGGLIGALTPSLYLLKPSHIESIQSRFSFDYGGYAFASAGFYLFLLLLPCILSTFTVYPWLYARQYQAARQSRKVSLPKFFVWGAAFALMATACTACFLSVEFVAMSFFQDRPLDILGMVAVLLGGPALFGIIGLFYFPLAVLPATAFVWVSHRWVAVFVRKELYAKDLQ